MLQKVMMLESGGRGSAPHHRGVVTLWLPRMRMMTVRRAALRRRVHFRPRRRASVAARSHVGPCPAWRRCPHRLRRRAQRRRSMPPLFSNCRQKKRVHMASNSKPRDNCACVRILASNGAFREARAATTAQASTGCGGSAWHTACRGCAPSSWPLRLNTPSNFSLPWQSSGSRWRCGRHRSVPGWDTPKLSPLVLCRHSMDGGVCNSTAGDT